MKYRLYVDEVGNSDLGASHDSNHRYLSLTGVIMELGYVDRTAFPAVEELKRTYFGSHPDDPVVFHRKELVNRKHPFEALREEATVRAFNSDLLGLLRRLDYTVISVVIDKLEHQERYQVWRHDPYHYCLEVLVERYVLWLRGRGAMGAVMAESRGGREDRRLKDSFERVAAEGSDFIEPEVFTAHLTSRQLKVKPKANNIAGLQLADLLAHPSFRATLARRHRQPLPENFGGEIAKVLEEAKYNRSRDGRIEGWGRKWLP
ncbi:MAG: DUF3800 domain-containing protein [Deltaproteobacteria bacterium]|nr:DUF3800 domain-containing protein [Deltaproteobacteria bacterium]